MAGPTLYLDAPARIPAPYGLLSVAVIAEETIPRWLGGGDAKLLGAPCVSPSISHLALCETETSPVVRDWHGLYAEEALGGFSLEVPVSCTPVGVGFAALTDAAVREFSLQESYGLERALYGGAGSADYPTGDCGGDAGGHLARYRRLGAAPRRTEPHPRSPSPLPPALRPCPVPHPVHRP